MKRLLFITILLVSVGTTFAQSKVKYSSDSMAKNWIDVEFTAQQGDTSKCVVLSITSQEYLLPQTPTILLKTFQGTVIKLKGTFITTSEKSNSYYNGRGTSNFVRQTSIAQFPITDEQIQQLGDGVCKIRITTVPENHEKEFSKDKIGKKLQAILKSVGTDDDF